MRDILNKLTQLHEADVQTLRKEIIDQVKRTQDEELLDKIFTVLNKSGLVDRITGTLKRDTDTQGYIQEITQIIIDTPGTYQEKYDFINGFPNGYVNVDLMLSGNRVKFEDLLDKNDFVRKVFDRLKRETFGTAKGPGEFALAVMSPHIKITGKGDLNIGDRIIEVKASAGKDVSSGGGRLGTPGSLHSDDVQKIIEKHLKVKFIDVVPGGNLGLGGLTKLASTLKPAQRTAFGKELFGYIFHGSANIGELVSTFTNGGDLRDAFITANYQSYKEETDFEGIMIMNFALGELHYFKDVTDLVRHVYNAIGVYLVSKDKAAQARQILTQVTLAPFKEPTVEMPSKPNEQAPKKVKSEFEAKLHEFAVDFAQKRSITDTAVMAQIFQTAMDLLLKDKSEKQVMDKLKRDFPAGSQSKATTAAKAKAAGPKTIPNVVTGKRTEIRPKGTAQLSTPTTGIGREKRGRQ